MNLPEMVTFWSKAPEFVPKCRPMADTLTVAIGRFPEHCYLTTGNIEGELLHLGWDNGKTLLWVSFMECGKWEWFFRDRSNEETHSNPDEVLVPGPEELLEAVRPHVERLRS